MASYIKRHAYSNAKTEDLWAALEEESGEPVNMLMNSWTKQKGYPVISVGIKDNKLEFEQVCLSATYYIHVWLYMYVCWREILGLELTLFKVENFFVRSTWMHANHGGWLGLGLSVGLIWVNNPLYPIIYLFKDPKF